jgi:2-iminobutanoate/2-iminopropanoate deaminase
MSQKRNVIATTEAPGAVGPYSQAIATDSFVYTAGQIPINPASGKIEAETIEEQTRQVLVNLEKVLLAAGSGLHQVVKMTVFMTDRLNSKFGSRNSEVGIPLHPPAFRK